MSKSKRQLKIKAGPKVAELLKVAFEVAQPPPDMTTSEWADNYRRLTSDNSPIPGPWETDFAPYVREVMDSFDDPHVWKIVMMWGVQLGKSEILLNRMGRNIHLDPGPMLFSFPDDEAAKDFSKDRIQPMLEASPELRRRVIEQKSKTKRDSTVGTKRFPGGYLAMVSARTPTSFASRAIRDLFMDELDRYPKSAGKEGSPVALAEKRTTNFWNRKIALASSPGDDEESHIAKEYDGGDQRKWYCPCPHCDEHQLIMWENVHWDKEKRKDGTVIHKPETAHIVCIYCGCVINEVERIRMIRAGEWRATAPFNGVKSYWLSSLNSVFAPLSTFVREFVDINHDPQKLKAFTNTRLAELWVEQGTEIKSDRLYDRREEYAAQVPAGAYILTAGVDTQDDRLEITVDGWGDGEENWVIDHVTLWGDPKEPKVWKELESYLTQTFTHESGVKLNISATCIDSAGHNTSMVYSYCEGKESLRQFAIIGRDGESRPAISAPSEKRTGSNKRPVKLFTVGVDGIKALIYSRLLSVKEPGAGYTHFPHHLYEEYFRQLTSEKVVDTYERGLKKRIWKKLRTRNEALDCKVYSYAALKTLLPNWQEWKRAIIGTGEPQKNAVKRRRRLLSKGIHDSKDH